MADLSPQDLRQLEQRGIDLAEFERQLECFRRGFPPLDLVGPATLERGIETLVADRRPALVSVWERAARAGRVTKFVPASGAASRMFKALETRRKDPTPLTPDALAVDRGLTGDPAQIARFFDRFDDFAFAPEVREALRKAGHDPDEILRGEGDRRVALDVMLDDLGYADMPKGLIPFHKTPDGPRTAFLEHLDEAHEVVAVDRGAGRVHFTVPPDYRARIEQHCAGSTHDVSYSEQSPATDTVAVDLENRPLRDDDGRLVFRPGGHGALIGNLDALAGDVVLVKNIDNVLPASRRASVVEHQRLLAGLAIERQQEAHDLWRRLHDDDEVIEEALVFVQNGLHRTPPTAIATGSVHAQRTWLFDVLARPLRVCGMVRNEGEPGGGPFWVRSGDGSESLQIVESSQIDHDDPAQEKHFRASTHFNPVDLVCAVRDPEGRPHDLHRFVDADTGFIARKSKDGVDLKALERPGLWNGAMAHWNTIFVEVPLTTFNPVKTVFDLLRSAHQG
mgnify:CR=1 FL=1